MSVSIDDSLYDNLEWIKSKTKADILGITTMVPINNLKNGFHSINIYTDYKSKNWSPDHGEKEFQIKIPFWVDK